MLDVNTKSEAVLD